MTRLLTASLALLAFGACTTDSGDEGMFVSRVLAPNADCTFAADQTAPFISHGEYQLGAGGDYQPSVQVESRITATDTNITQRTVQLRGARVKITNVDGSAIAGAPEELVNFKTLTSGPVKPSGGITPVDFVLVPYRLSQFLEDKADENGQYFVLTSFEVYGDMDGSEVTSQRFLFPVTLSLGTGVQNRGTCPLPFGTVVHTSSNGCSLYSEGFTDCCTQGGNLVCPATVSTTAPMN